MLDLLYPVSLSSTVPLFTFLSLAPFLSAIEYQEDWYQTLQAQFMQDAMAGGVITAVLAAIIGYFVVLRRDTFATHAIGHIGFPGATAAAVVGVSPIVGLLFFCTLGGLAIGALGKEVERREIATGTILGFALALGVLFASLASQGQSAMTGVLFGNLLAISRDELAVFAVAGVAAIAALAVVARPLMFASVSPAVAQAKGVNVKRLGVIFLILLAVVTTMAIQVVGTLLLFALIVTPAATALLITARPATAIACAVGLGVFAVVVGLVLAAMFNLPPSFAIVGLATLSWLLALGLSGWKPQTRPASDSHHVG